MYKILKVAKAINILVEHEFNKNIYMTKKIEMKVYLKKDLNGKNYHLNLLGY